jgi:hypothetical protein
MFMPHRCFLPVFLILQFLFLTSAQGLAGDGIEQTGDVLTVALAASSLGMAAHRHDGEGAVQFAKSSALSLGATLVLKYTDKKCLKNPSEHLFFLLRPLY